MNSHLRFVLKEQNRLRLLKKLSGKHKQYEYVYFKSLSPELSEAERKILARETGI